MWSVVQILNQQKSCTTRFFTQYYITVKQYGVVSQCTSHCDDLNRTHRKIVKNRFSNFFINRLCIFREMRILKIDYIYKLTAASYMYNILKHDYFHILRYSLYMPYPSHNCRTRNKNDMLLPYPRVEAIRMSFVISLSKSGLESKNISNVNEHAQVLRMHWLIIVCHDIDDFISFSLVQSTLDLFTSWSSSRVNIIVTINSVFLFVLYFEFANWDTCFACYDSIVKLGKGVLFVFLCF